MAVIWNFFTIAVLFVSMAVADKTIDEIFSRLDDLGQKVTLLENEKLELKSTIGKQNETIDTLKSDLKRLEITLQQEDITLQNNLKVLQYKKLPALEKDVNKVKQNVMQNLTQNRLMLESQEDKWTQNFNSLTNTVSRVEANQSLIDAAMSGRITALEERMARAPQQDDISRLRTTITSSMDKLNDIENAVNSNKMTLESKINSDVKEVKDTLDVTDTAVKRENTKLKQQLVDLSNSLRQLQNATIECTREKTLPSFHASMTTVIPIQGPNQRIVYDTIKTNNGNGYDNSTGIFTVPESGTYVFTWTTFSYVEEYVRLEIVVAGEILGGTLSDTQETGDADTETGIIVVNVQQGDDVFIRTQRRGPGNGRLYVEFECASTFSGWKLS